MPDYADLLIRLYKQDDAFYGVELRYYVPNAVIDADVAGGKVSVESLNALEGVELDDPQAYGVQLKQALFADAQIAVYLSKVLGNMQGTDKTLRLRLQIPIDLAHLHSLRWETMPGLDGAKAVASDQNHPFSRFLAMDDWREIELRPRSKLRVLVVVANPKELDDKDQTWATHLAASGGKYEQVNLAKVNVAGEIDRARAALKEVHTIVELESRNPEARPTLENLKRYLNQGCDILYLVCHGALIAADLDQPVSTANPRLPKIILEDAEGGLLETSGVELANTIHSLDANLRPRLVVLSSCQSAGDGRSTDQGALTALGPLLVRAGVPAVVAMQGDVLMQTADKFVPRFFAELLKHGMLDKAMAAARLEIDQQDDWWAPVLFTCLRGGQLFYDLGFAQQDAQFDLWPNLMQNIRRERYNDLDEKEIVHKCTPVIGPDLSEFLIGTSRELAHRWSAPENFDNGEVILNSLPSVAAYLSANPDDLPYFAQYLAVQQSHEFVPADMINHLRSVLVDQNKANLPDEILAQNAPNLRQVINILGQQQHALKREAYAYHILASLPFTVYISANPDNLLEEALNSHGRKPVVEYARWHPALLTQPFFSSGSLSNYVPSEEQPLIFHMFGNFRTENSLVLSEDDYFEYLVNVNSFGLPVVIQDLLNSHALLFLGFRLSDWSFRVLFHSLLDENRKQARQVRLKDNKSIAVQLQPSDRIARPELVRSFLEKYMPPEFRIYWGAADLFLGELWEKYPKTGVYPCQISQG